MAIARTRRSQISNTGPALPDPPGGQMCDHAFAHRRLSEALQFRDAYEQGEVNYDWEYLRPISRLRESARTLIRAFPR